MKKNNFFDPVRFFGLLRQDLLFNYKFYLSFVVGSSMGIYLLSSLLIRNSSNYLNNSLTQQVFNSAVQSSYSTNFHTSFSYISSYFVLYNLVFATTIVFIGMSFPAFRNHGTTSNYQLTPGSTFEKLLVQFVVRFVLFIPLVMFLLRVDIYLAIASMVPDPKTGFDPLFIDEFSYGTLFLSSGGLIINPISDLAYLFASFAGAAYFRRYAVVKTQLVITLFTVALLLTFLFAGERNWLKLGTDFLRGSNFYFALSPVSIGFFLLSLPWAYYKLKEKEL